MSICLKLHNGQSNACPKSPFRYYQQAVLVNRSDVRNKLIQTSTTNISGDYECRNRVYFDLNPGTKGHRFSVGENASVVFGMFEKTEQNDIPQYSHAVNIVLTGVDEDTKCQLKQLDLADYFAALQTYDGLIEIFGFEYGLTTSNYTYDPANLTGGAIIKLNSLADSLEDEPPFVYKSQNPGDEISDFDSEFENSELNLLGDFNDDFNFDFNAE